MENKTKITISTSVNASPDKVWEYWTSPSHIVKWNHASEDWHTTKAENDLKAGGNFLSRMEAKDGSFGFDFGGTYTAVEPHQHIAYTLEDDRKVAIDFKKQGNEVLVTETFEAESENPVDMQRDGWQAILNNFKKYTEEN